MQLTAKANSKHMYLNCLFSSDKLFTESRRTFVLIDLWSVCNTGHAGIPRCVWILGGALVRIKLILHAVPWWVKAWSLFAIVLKFTVSSCLCFFYPESSALPSRKAFPPTEVYESNFFDQINTFFFSGIVS